MLVTIKFFDFLECFWVAANDSFEDITYPKPWKKGKLSYFLKPSKASKMSLSSDDFRPISVACCLSKVMELIGARRLEDELDSLGQRKEHFGFRKMRGATDIFAGMISKIRSNLEQKLKSALLLLDFKSAYNKVDRARLLWKLYKLKIDPGLIR